MVTVNVDESMIHADPVLGERVVVMIGGVVVVVVIAPLFRIQFGNCVHDPVLKQVTFRLPPVFTYPLAHAKTINEFTNTVVVSCADACKFF